MSTIDRFKFSPIIAEWIAEDHRRGLGDVRALTDGTLLGRPAWENLARIMRAWEAADLVMQDWDDPFGTAVAACMDLASLLVSWESPEWGNIGGRWDVDLGIGGLRDEHWAALAECLTDENDTAWRAVWDVEAGEHQGVYLPGLFRYLSADDAHLADVVRLGDLLADIVDKCKELGKDY